MLRVFWLWSEGLRRLRTGRRGSMPRWLVMMLAARWVDAFLWGRGRGGCWGWVGERWFSRVAKAWLSWRVWWSMTGRVGEGWGRRCVWQLLSGAGGRGRGRWNWRFGRGVRVLWRCMVGWGLLLL